MKTCSRVLGFEKDSSRRSVLSVSLMLMGYPLADIPRGCTSPYQRGSVSVGRNYDSENDGVGFSFSLESRCSMPALPNFTLQFLGVKLFPGANRGTAPIYGPARIA